MMRFQITNYKKKKKNHEKIRRSKRFSTMTYQSINNKHCRSPELRQYQNCMYLNSCLPLWQKPDIFCQNNNQFFTRHKNNNLGQTMNEALAKPDGKQAEPRENLQKKVLRQMFHVKSLKDTILKSIKVYMARIVKSYLSFLAIFYNLTR